MDSSTAEFTRLWTANLPKIAAFVGSMVYEISDREDVLQDCALAAMTSFERFDQKRSFPAWATGVARNQIRLYFRRKSKDPHIFDDDALDTLVDAFAEIRPEENEQLSHLEHCVNKPDEKARRLCEYRYAQELKPAAIASQLGMTPNTVAKSLQRIRDQLRQCIERSPNPAS